MQIIKHEQDHIGEYIYLTKTLTAFNDYHLRVNGLPVMSSKALAQYLHELVTNHTGYREDGTCTRDDGGV